MPDAAFAEPRLAALYDALDQDRSDLDLYVAVAAEFAAVSVLDIGCGTGTLACLFAQQDLHVTAVDPASASLDVAKSKPAADRVRWIVGDACTLPPLAVDLAVMTGNVAQVFLTDEQWAANLSGIGGAVRPGGLLTFEARNPGKEAWQSWTREASYSRTQVGSLGMIGSWVEVVDVSAPFVSFRAHYEFEMQGEVLTSDSTLRFRDMEEFESSLRDAGFARPEVRDAPDRPGLEWIFLAERQR